MPSKSAKQHRLMAMVAHDPKAAKRLGIPQSVGKEFAAADKGKKFKEGGMAKTDKLKKIFKGKESYAEELKEAKAIKSGKISPEEYAKGEKDIEGHKCGGKIKKYASGGTTKAGKSMPEAKDMGAMGLKKGGSCKRYVGGGQAEPDKPTPEQRKQMQQQVQDEREKKASSEAYEKITGKKFARGGGVEIRGKTRGRII